MKQKSKVTGISRFSAVLLIAMAVLFITGCSISYRDVKLKVTMGDNMMANATVTIENINRDNFTAADDTGLGLIRVLYIYTDEKLALIDQSIGEGSINMGSLHSFGPGPAIGEITEERYDGVYDYTVTDAENAAFKNGTETSWTKTLSFPVEEAAKGRTITFIVVLEGVDNSGTPEGPSANYGRATSIPFKYSAVTFDANGHGTSPGMKYFEVDGKLTKPADPSASGWSFGGWYKEPECKTAWDFNTGVVEDNMTLYAKWTEDPTKQMGEDGTAFGPGASAEAADAAILALKDDKDPAGTVFGALQLKASKTTKSSIKLTWKKVSGAKKYIIYANKCGKGKKYQKLTTVTGKSYTAKKVAGAKLKKGTYYKFLMVAVDGSNKVVSSSKTVHAATAGGKVGNPTKVTTKAKKNKVTVKAKKTFKLAAKQAGKKIKKHRAVSYETSDPKVATVTTKGVIKGVKKGSCKVYAYAQNGVCAVIKVTVK